MDALIFPMRLVTARPHPAAPSAQGACGSCGTAARGASGSQQVVVGFARRRAGRRLREAVCDGGRPRCRSWRRVCRRPSVSGRFNHLRGVGGRRDLKLSSFERRLCVSETTRDCTQFVYHYRRPLSACGQRSITRNRPPPPPARQTLLEQLPQDRSAL